MNKINVRINIDKIDKTKIKSRTYKNAVGVMVTVRELEVEILPIREEKIVHTTAEYDFVKVGFMSDKSVKNANGTWDNGTPLGDAIEIRKKAVAPEPVVELDIFGDPVPEAEDTGAVPNPDDIPF